MEKKRTKNKNSSGFYLVEAIIAIFLLTVGLLVTVDLLSKVMTNTMADRDNNTAVLLAQEGIELVRNMRDNNFAQEKDAFDGCFFCTVDDDTAKVHYGAGYAMDCNPASPTYYNLYYNIYGFYGSGETADKSKFQRRVSVDYDGATGTSSTYATITSIVTWKMDAASINVGSVAADCTAAKGCAYAQTKLTKWE